ncbi:MAG: hypothetical protein L0I29_18905 [Hyphomicrobiales bacterium]|nr:hypothetical protein [Hyphomicrobiales bacterium]
MTQMLVTMFLALMLLPTLVRLVMQPPVDMPDWRRIAVRAVTLRRRP